MTSPPRAWSSPATRRGAPGVHGRRRGDRRVGHETPREACNQRAQVAQRRALDDGGVEAPGWLAAQGLPARLVRHDGRVARTCGWPEADGGRVSSPVTSRLADYRELDIL